MAAGLNRASPLHSSTAGSGPPIEPDRRKAVGRTTDIPMAVRLFRIRENPWNEHSLRFAQESARNDTVAKWGGQNPGPALSCWGVEENHRLNTVPCCMFKQYRRFGAQSIRLVAAGRFGFVPLGRTGQARVCQPCVAHQRMRRSGFATRTMGSFQESCAPGKAR